MRGLLISDLGTMSRVLKSSNVTVSNSNVTGNYVTGNDQNYG